MYNIINHFMFNTRAKKIGNKLLNNSQCINFQCDNSSTVYCVLCLSPCTMDLKSNKKYSHCLEGISILAVCRPAHCWLQFEMK